MKTNQFFSITLIAGVSLVAGCATPALNLESNAPSVAKTLNVPASDITYLGSVAFGQAPPSGIHVTFTDGVVVLTRDTLVLMAGKLPDSVPVQHIKFREMRGVDLHHFGRDRQLQILTASGITVVARIPTTEQVYQTLLQHGVPAWKSDKHYLMKVNAPIIIPIPM